MTSIRIASITSLALSTRIESILVFNTRSFSFSDFFQYLNFELDLTQNTKTILIPHCCMYEIFVVIIIKYWEDYLFSVQYNLMSDTSDNDDRPFFSSNKTYYVTYAS